jgi:tetratricopeptide (TPR) repeat protein
MQEKNELVKFDRKDLEKRIIRLSRYLCELPGQKTRLTKLINHLDDYLDLIQSEQAIFNEKFLKRITRMIISGFDFADAFKEEDQEVSKKRFYSLGLLGEIYYNIHLELTHDVDKTNCLVTAGYLYLRAGVNDKADELFNKARETNPEYAELLIGMAYGEDKVYIY